MKKAIVTITAYDRIDLLERCLVHLSRNDQSLFNVIVFPDKVDDATLLQIKLVAERVKKETGLTVEVWPRPEKQLYCCLNILRSVDTVARLFNPEYIIKLDSDLLVTKDFVKVMLALSESMGGGMSVSSIICHLPLFDKQAMAAKIRDISLAGSNFAISSKWWAWVSATAKPLIERMKGKPNHEYDCVRDWNELKAIADTCNPTHPGAIAGKEYFFKNDHNTASDAIIVLGAAVCDCPISSLVVNRAIHPSTTGVNTTAEFHAANYANTFLDDIEGDDTRTVFEY